MMTKSNGWNFCPVCKKKIPGGTTAYLRHRQEDDDKYVAAFHRIHKPKQVEVTEEWAMWATGKSSGREMGRWVYVPERILKTAEVDIRHQDIVHYRIEAAERGGAIILLRPLLLEKKKRKKPKRGR